MYPLSVSPAAPNGRCVTPREAPCPGSPGGQEVGPPRVIQLMPSTIMNPLLLSPSRSGGGAAMDFRHSRGGPPSQATLENGREGKVHSHHHQIPLSQQHQQQHLLQQQEEVLYRNQVIMPVSPPEEQQIPIGRIAGKILSLTQSKIKATRGDIFTHLWSQCEQIITETAGRSLLILSLWYSLTQSITCKNKKKNPSHANSLCVSLLCPCRLQAAVGLRLPAPVRQQVRELHPLGGSREQSLPHHGPQRPGQALGQSQGKHTLWLGRRQLSEQGHPTYRQERRLHL